MARIPQRTIDLIITTADIVEVVNEFIPLKRRGTNFWGLSPFKREKTPSFAVSPSKNIFKDFSSGTGGNVVSFLMETQGMSYVEALKYLAKKYGIEIPEDARGEGEDDATQKRRDALLGINKFAAGFFTSQLMESEEGRQRAGTYLDGRGFDGPTRQLFQLGYSPEAWEALTQAAVKRGYKAEDLQELGLSILSEKTGRPFDRFRSRLIFPLHDAGGQIIGFAGRILDKDAKGAKYVNSPESVLYDKSRFLYGLYFAKQSIREEKEAILVEGYTDVIGLYQAGVKNAVASSGTSLTEPQIALLKRHCDKLLVLFDGDAAGVKASLRGIGLLVQAGMHVRVLPLPPEHDPDSFIREHGAKGFREYAKTHAVDFLRFMVDALADGRSLEDPNVQGEVLSATSEVLAYVADEVQRNLYLGHLSRLLKIELDTVILSVTRVVERLRKQNVVVKSQQLKEEIITTSAALGLTVRKKRNYLNASDYLLPVEYELSRLIVKFFSDSVYYNEQFRRVPDILKEVTSDFKFYSDDLQYIISSCISAYEAGKQKLPLNSLLITSTESVRDIMALLLEDEVVLSPIWIVVEGKRLTMDHDIEDVLHKAIEMWKLRRLEVLEQENIAKLKQINHYASDVDSNILDDEFTVEQIEDVRQKIELEEKKLLTTSKLLGSLKLKIAKELGVVMSPRFFYLNRVHLGLGNLDTDEAYQVISSAESQLKVIRHNKVTA